MNKMEHFPTTERLHTDVLEEKYGPVHVEMLEHTDKMRKAHLVDQKGVSRTFAVTFFPESWPNPEIAQVNAEIAAGHAIGKTFRKYGYSIRKNVIDVYIAEVPESLREKFATEEATAKVRLAEFYAKKQGAEPVIYGVVAEVYSPDFRPAVVNQFDQSQISAATVALENNGIPAGEVWRRIGIDNDYHDLETQLQLAQGESREQLESWKKQIAAVLESK